MTSAVTRRLAAIVIADVAGYSRLMERDDTGTFARLRSIRDEIVDPAVVSHDGRIVKTAGDGFLAEFPSALAALRASVQIQREMAKRNEGAATEDRIDYRIGVNLGDVMADKDDIAGDGVNVASRLEALAKAGGICVSGSVREQVHGQMAVAFEDIGEQRVKNIERPIRAYSLALSPHSAVQRVGDEASWRSLGSRLSIRWRRAGVRRASAAALVLVVAAGGAGIAWWRMHPAAIARVPALSVGVLPLAGSSENPASSALRESLTRDMATQLARSSPVLRIVPAVTPKDGGLDATAIRAVAERIEVRFLLEGDVRQATESTEVRLRLVDGTSGEQRWSEVIVLKGATESPEARRALRAAMGHAGDRVFDLEKQRVLTLDPSTVTPLELALRARAQTFTGTSPSLEAFRKMEALCEQALRRDPELLYALTCVNYALDNQNDLDSNADRARIVRRMDEVTLRAVNRNRDSSVAWAARAGVLMMMGRWDAAREASARSVDLDPDGAEPLEGHAWIMTMEGRPDEAVRLAHEAVARDPPGGWWVIRAECEALLLMGRYADAVTACERAAGRSGTDFDIAYFLAAAYAHTGNQKRAAEEAAKILYGAPGFTIAVLRAKGYSTHPDYVRLAEEHWYSGLRKAGIPET